MRLRIISIILIVLFITGCNGQQITGDVVRDESIQFANETFPTAVATLPPLDLNTVDRYEDYQIFADRMNMLIEILNRELDYDIPLFPKTREAWSKASMTITKYSPLINNYNEVVLTAKSYSTSQTDESKKEFYLSTARFGFETALIVWAVFYTAAYESVGIVYRSIGLNTMAVKHPVLVKTILSNWHWLLRNTLVETASQSATKAFNSSVAYFGSEDFKKVISNIEQTAKSAKQKLKDWLNNP